jgi:hypothetical protein
MDCSHTALDWTSSLACTDLCRLDEVAAGPGKQFQPIMLGDGGLLATGAGGRLQRTTCQRINADSQAHLVDHSLRQSTRGYSFIRLLREIDTPSRFFTGGWTAGMAPFQHFQRRQGSDPIPRLPAMLRKPHSCLPLTTDELISQDTPYVCLGFRGECRVWRRTRAGAEAKHLTVCAWGGRSVRSFALAKGSEAEAEAEADR